MSGIERWRTIARVGLPLLETGIVVGGLLWFGYDYETRNFVKDRDGWKCQMAGCGCGDSLTVHHMAPQSILSAKTGHRNGVYTDAMCFTYKFFMEEAACNPKERHQIRDMVYAFVHGDENAITVCSTHHTNLHSDNLIDFSLYDNTRHVARPPYLAVPYVQGMLVGQIAPFLERKHIDAYTFWHETVDYTYNELLKRDNKNQDVFEQTLDSYYNLVSSDFDFLKTQTKASVHLY